jgi:RNA polymerase sigma factor (sigma-70 family)
VDSGAFERLFDREFDTVFGYVARRVGPDLGRDLAAEVFTRAFEARGRYDSRRGGERAWLFGIAQNVLRRHYRDEERRLRVLSLLPPERVDDEQPDWLVADALARLSADERDVLLLYAWADLRYEEIAAALGVPVGTVRSRLHRARERVRAALTKETVDG